MGLSYSGSRIGPVPFTISHTIAVLPLFRWRRLDPLGLVIGSMAPDFGYFVHRFAFAGEAHSFMGSFMKAFPVAALVWLTCRLASGFLIRPLPPSLRAMAAARLEGFRWQLSALLWVPLSLLLGIWSHIAWDSFTHRQGWVVSRVPLLDWPVYHWLQHASSIIGMTVLMVTYWKFGGRGSQDVKNGNAKVLVILALLAVITAMPFAWNFASQYPGAKQWRVFVFREVVYAMAIGACAYLTYAMVLQAQVWKHRWKAAISSPK